MLKLTLKLQSLSLVFIALGILTHCSGQRLVERSSVVYKPEQPQSHRINAIPEYCLGFGDVLEIKFFNNEKFNELVTVRPDGRITLQRLGDIQVTGMTPVTLDSIITDAYSKILINPDVTVFVREFGGNQVYVLGEVNQPGGFPIQQSMDVLQAVASAGGAKTGAKLSSVVVLRKRPGGEIEARKVDLSAFMKGSNPSGDYDLTVRPQDIVFVPKTLVANLSTFMKQVYDGVMPPIDSYLRFLYWNRY